MIFIFLFSIGIVNPTLEMHLLEYDLSNTSVALCFLLLAATYTFFIFVGSCIFKKIDKRTTMFAGINILGIGFLMLAPWEIIYPNEL